MLWAVLTYTPTPYIHLFLYLVWSKAVLLRDTHLEPNLCMHNTIFCLSAVFALIRAEWQPKSRLGRRRRRSLDQSTSSSLTNQILHGPFAVQYVQRKSDGLWIIWQRPTDTEGKLINLELLKLLACAEYKMTPKCGSQHRSSFLMFDPIMSVIPDVTVDEQTERGQMCLCFRFKSWPLVFFYSFQLDADRDEEEVFCDISMTLDNKLFPSKEPAAGEMSIYLIKHKQRHL